MLNQSGERTLLPAIAPPNTTHINTVFGLVSKNNLPYIAGLESSLPYDYYIKSTGKSDGRFDTFSKFPYPDKYVNEISIRALLLNCLTINYAELWKNSWTNVYTRDSWSLDDNRIKKYSFSSLEKNWNPAYIVKDDFSRRYTLVEIDVLVSMALGLSLNQLLTIYDIQFPILKKIEDDTWYDANGRIVFTCSTNLPGVGFERKEWENIKDAPAGTKFYRTITDDTMPGGPIERTIEYVAPFDRCDREKDYETAWAFFEKQYELK